MNAKKRIRKLLTTGARKVKYRKGFGIHSPFVFSLITQVIYENFPFYDYIRLKKIRDCNSMPRSVKNGRILRRKMSLKLLLLYYRLVNRFQPDNILELNNNGGVPTMALAMPKKNARVITMGVTPEKLAKCKSVIEKEGQNNITVIDGDQLAWLKEKEDGYKADFILINKSRHIQTYNYLYDNIDKIISNNGIIIVDGISVNETIRTFWDKLCLNEKVKVSLDLYEFGIAIYNEKLFKQHYIVSF